MNGRPSMHSLTLLWRSLRFFRRQHLAVALGTALSAAILTGALIVGDSANHTLRTHARERLGAVSQVVLSYAGAFSESLVAPWAERLNGPPAAGLLTMEGVALRQDDATGVPVQVPRVHVLGVEDSFWAFGDGPGWKLEAREAVLNQRLAQALGVDVGDTIALRLAKPGLLSRDAPLSSREDDATVRANFTVKGIATDAGLGRFSLSPSQVPPDNCFIALDTMQQLLERDDDISLLIAGGETTEAEAQAALRAAWTPAQSGLEIQHPTDTTLLLASQSIFLRETVADVALTVPGASGTLTYLVNGIRGAAGATPYSFMTAGGPLADGLDEDGVVINTWLADQAGAKVGDTLTVAYYELTPSNQFVERERDFQVRKVVPMDALAEERALVPEFPGLSNVESCRDWKIGMPMDEDLLRDKPNEAYWNEYRQTPKAFVSLAAGQAMWANRFGCLTGVRFDASQTTPDELMAALAERLGPGDFGIDVRPVREEAAQAVAHATDLGGLFLGMSFFLLVSALVLTGMLHAFGAQQRAAEAGLLRAVGYTRRRIHALWLGETALVAVPASIVGAMAGAGYAAALLFGLTRLWGNVVGRVPLLFAARPQSLAIGMGVTLVCALLAAAWTLRRLLKRDATGLLTADFTQSARVAVRGLTGLVLAIVFLAGAVGLVAYALIEPPVDPAGLFFGSGFLALVGGLLLVRHTLTATTGANGTGVPSTLAFARMNASRRRERSLGLVASLAAGSFLVLAVASMQADVGGHADQRWAGTGGFELYAETTLPVLDLDTGSLEKGVRAVPFRVLDGDDASCLNLNHALHPRLLGVDTAVMEKLGAFVDHANDPLWALLDQDYGPGVVPALVGDSDTAMWTLQKSTGPEEGDVLPYRDEAGNDIQVKLVGRLPMRLSVFQGTLLVSEEALAAHWPSREGYRVFLVDTPADNARPVRDTLTAKWQRQGVSVTSTVERLRMFYVVEETYLHMFLVLGGLGLLLGAVATGVVVLRNLQERRGEIALLQAVGFPSAAVFRVLSCEYGLLLAMGAATGAGASLLAMVPAVFGAHGSATPLWRLLVLAGVVAAAGLSAWAALAVGLRHISPSALRDE